jgi:hypothetical protein
VKLGISTRVDSDAPDRIQPTPVRVTGFRHAHTRGEVFYAPVKASGVYLDFKRVGDQNRTSVWGGNLPCQGRKPRKAETRFATQV